MLIKDKAGGPLLQAELEPPLGDGPPVLVADNGRKTFEIDIPGAKQYYKLISATKSELIQLKRAGYTMDLCDEFQAREG